MPDYLIKVLEFHTKIRTVFLENDSVDITSYNNIQNFGTDDEPKYEIRTDFDIVHLDKHITVHIFDMFDEGNSILTVHIQGYHIDYPREIENPSIEQRSESMKDIINEITNWLKENI